MEQRAGSVSDPESEEENEEGDYTVYECPGFATVRLTFQLIIFIWEINKQSIIIRLL